MHNALDLDIIRDKTRHKPSTMRFFSGILLSLATLLNMEVHKPFVASCAVALSSVALVRMTSVCAFTTVRVRMTSCYEISRNMLILRTTIT